ncbi:chemotaxis protein CheX [Gracilibacillus ureilyticus]|uniref:Chemotaxis protein CheX n=1 Tax=Gracilibacillus ureilyticus TaxID=531814 RepID=A0A1H9S2J5_9BACI|nr:chemotaxis protein CheX [Gracilibacillus ureilyticus]SER79217.1 chemotaxis protein CheX [Gracilibacillus ureilyticus]
MTSSSEVNMNEIIKELYNGSVQSIKNVVPVDHQFDAPKLTTEPLQVQYGVLIGYSGTFKGDLLIQAKHNVFSAIGEALYGMQLSEEMLDSFSGELGNMVAGGLSTHLANAGIETDITHPTIISGDAKLTGFKRVLEVQINYEEIGGMTMSLLLNQ